MFAYKDVEIETEERTAVPSGQRKREKDGKAESQQQSQSVCRQPLSAGYVAQPEPSALGAVPDALRQHLERVLRIDEADDAVCGAIAEQVLESLR